MWREYVRMELSFIEGLRRRWDVLGIHAGDKGKEVFRDGNNTEGLDMNGGEAVEGAASRLEVMQGAIVKSVVTSAVQGAVGRCCEGPLINSIHSAPKNRTF